MGESMSSLVEAYRVVDQCIFAIDKARLHNLEERTTALAF